jgi:hypothetical protein
VKDFIFRVSRRIAIALTVIAAAAGVCCENADIQAAETFYILLIAGTCSASAEVIAC